MSEAIHGACLCGGVAFDVESEALVACYCTRCRRWTGGPGATVAVVGAENFKLTKGQDLMKLYREEGFADRYFAAIAGRVSTLTAARSTT